MVSMSWLFYGYHVLEGFNGNFTLGETFLTPCWSETRIGKYSIFWITFEKKISNFLAVLCALGFKVSQKVLVWPQKFFFTTLLYWCQKTQNLIADFKSVEKSCPSNLLSGSTLPPPPFPVYKYTVYSYTVCKGGSSGSQTRQINTCRKVPLQVNFLRWRHFAWYFISLIFLWFGESTLQCTCRSPFRGFNDSRCREFPNEMYVDSDSPYRLIREPPDSP
jgi:hypothetical protein